MATLEKAIVESRGVAELRHHRTMQQRLRGQQELGLGDRLLEVSDGPGKPMRTLGWSATLRCAELRMNEAVDAASAERDPVHREVLKARAERTMRSVEKLTTR